MDQSLLRESGLPTIRSQSAEGFIEQPTIRSQSAESFIGQRSTIGPLSPKTCTKAKFKANTIHFGGYHSVGRSPTLSGTGEHYRPVSINDELDQESHWWFHLNLAGLICYVCLGQIIGFLRGWTPIDSFYFTVTVFTTVGYGDLTFGATDDNWQLWGCLFILLGVFIFALTWSTFFSYVVSREETAVRLFAKERAQGKAGVINQNSARIRRLFRKVLAPRQKDQPGNRIGLARSLQEEAGGRLKVSLTLALTRFLALILIVTAVMKEFEQREQKWSFRTSLYWAVTTASTVGFGDVAPKTQAGRFLATVLLLVSVATWTQTLGVLASYRSLLGEVHARDRVLTQFGTTLTKEEFATLSHGNEMLDLRLCSQMDNVTKDEFCLFMLVKLGRVSREELHACQDAFNALDITHTGKLDWTDVDAHEEERESHWGSNGQLDEMEKEWKETEWNPLRSAVKQCTNCKNKLMDDAKFCRKCGKPRRATQN